MIVVAVAAAMTFGFVRRRYTWLVPVAIILGSQSVAWRYVRARCRAEGREPGEADRARAETIRRWSLAVAGLLYFAATKLRR
jgi:hypothetical protein